MNLATFSLNELLMSMWCMIEVKIANSNNIYYNMIVGISKSSCFKLIQGKHTSYPMWFSLTILASFSLTNIFLTTISFEENPKVQKTQTSFKIQPVFYKNLHSFLKNRSKSVLKIKYRKIFGKKRNFSKPAQFWH